MTTSTVRSDAQQVTPDNKRKRVSELWMMTFFFQCSSFQGVIERWRFVFHDIFCSDPHASLCLQKRSNKDKMKAQMMRRYGGLVHYGCVTPLTRCKKCCSVGEQRCCRYRLADGADRHVWSWTSDGGEAEAPSTSFRDRRLERSLSLAGCHSKKVQVLRTQNT